LVRPAVGTALVPVPIQACVVVLTRWTLSTDAPP
jgi:hypothetical protein